MDDNLNNFDYDSHIFIKLAKLEDKKRKIKKKKNKINTTTIDLMKSKTLKKLETPIDRKNKGFKLLQKMGFKEGDTLGINSNGLVEPIKINTLNIARKNIKQLPNFKEEKIKNTNLESNLNLNLLKITKKISKLIQYLKIILNLNETNSLELIINKTISLFETIQFKIEKCKLEELINIISFTNIKIYLQNNISHTHNDVLIKFEKSIDDILIFFEEFVMITFNYNLKECDNN